MDLTPVQRRTLVEVMGSRVERPVFDPRLADRLRASLERRLEPAVAALADGERLWVTKGRLADLHARCEGLFLANELEAGEFDYSPKLALGALVHRAIQIGVYRPHLTEGELVAGALGQLRRDDERFAGLLESLPEADRAELEAEAVRQSVLFRATFPPLSLGWTPAVELGLKADVAGGRVVLSARPDIVLGTVDPEDPMRARRLVLELKTGMDLPEHDEDLRFYALVATLRFGVPPFRVATVRLDDGSARHYDVTEDLLESAIRRVGDGYARAAALLGGEEPRLRPGAWCSWCARRDVCPQSAARGA